MLGERIHRARKARGLSQQDLAELAGVSRMAISKYESGRMAPSSPVLIAISRATGVRVESFFRPTLVALEQPQFRKRVSLSRKVQRQVEADLLDQVERYLEVIDLYPEPPLAPFRVPDGLPARVEHLDAVEEVAEALRASWNLGGNAIRFLAELLEEKGLLVLTTEVPSGGRFDGLAAMVGSWPVVGVGGRQEWPGDRQRFTMAHELGHLVLAGRLAEGLDEEKACNRFAGAFLVPRGMVRQELGARRNRLEWRELHTLKHAYGASMGAWVFRAAQAGVIDETTRVSLFRERSRRGWHQGEPGTPVRPEQPKLFERLVMHAHAEGMASTSKAAELLGMTVAAFRERLQFKGSDDAADH
ncbi:MAG: helix-turn-helix domain-containing protein [Deltaproteobacteria bacterium]|nr:MAG: helix-turn-helix domain-containing protein [Deltaproteobacteria bacterium]